MRRDPQLTEEEGLVLLQVLLCDAAPAVSPSAAARIFDAAKAHNVEAYLWGRLNRLGIAIDLPQGTRHALAIAYEDCAAQNALLIADVIRLAKVTADCDGVFLKGVPLILAFYPSPAERHLDDIDIAVPERCEQQFLQRLGEEEGCDLFYATNHLGERAELPRAVRAPNGTAVDLHFGETLGPIAELHAAGAPAPIRVPPPAELLSSLCSHVLVHHAAHPRYLLRHVCDVAVVLDRHPELRQLQVDSVVRSVRMFDAARGALGQSAQRSMCHRLLSPSVFTGTWAELRMTMGGIKRALRDNWTVPSRLARMLVPARSYMAQRYGIDACSRLMPLYYMRRVVELIPIARRRRP